MIRLRWIVIGCLFLLCTGADAQAGFGVYNVSTKVGLDVVQSNDTRHFYALQSDVATVFTPRLRLEVGGEWGSGTDLDDTEIRSIGGGAFLKYLWPNESKTAFAYMGGGLGLNQVRRQRLILNTYEYDMQLSLHIILIGMQKNLMKGRMSALFEVRWVIGEQEDATSLRTAVGVGMNFGRP